MKQFALIAVIAIASCALGQSEPVQTPPPGAQTTTGTGTAKSTSQSQAGATGDTASQMGKSGSRHDMSTEVANMRANLEALRTAVTKMDEGPAHDAAEQNVKMWEALVGHMERMSAHRSGMNGHSHMMSDTPAASDQGKPAKSPSRMNESQKPIEPK